MTNLSTRGLERADTLPRHRTPARRRGRRRRLGDPRGQPPGLATLTLDPSRVFFVGQTMGGGRASIE